jgi:Mg-chelatase subunit ChlD
MGGGRRHRSRRGRGRKSGRGRKGGSFLAEITVPAALLAATQYMKGPSSYRRTKRRGSRRRNRSSQRRRRR